MSFIILSVATVWLLAYNRGNLLAWTGTFALLLSLRTFGARGLTGLGWLVWLAFLAAAVIVNVPLMRRALLLLDSLPPPFHPTARRMSWPEPQEDESDSHAWTGMP